MPTVTIVSCPFAPVARSIAEARGFAQLSLVEIEHPVGASEVADVERKAEVILDAVASALVDQGRPRVTETGGGGQGAPERGVVEVEYDGAVMAERMFELGWTDGLPGVPPTSEAVAEMLTGTARGRSEIVGVVPPAMGAATVELVAANAVLAGCRPSYLPVLLAAVEAICDPAYRLFDRQISTHAGAPLLIVNGPLRDEIGLNSGTGVFGPGWRANATIGRALRLILINIGGAVPGEVDMSQHGHPGKYTYCIGENEERSPWEALHVERGFNQADNAVTVVNAEAPHLISEQMQTHARGILETCATVLATVGNNNIYSQGEPILVVGPEHAAYIAADGWTKRDVKLFLYEVARQPFGAIRGRGKSRGPRFPMWIDVDRDDDRVPIVAHPDDLIIVVAGGNGGKSMAIPTAGGMSRSVTKAVEPWR